jgi:hypothetical protein
MIEEIIIDYLGDQQTLPVYAELPVNPPAEYIVLQRTGGAEENLIREATVAVQAVTKESRFRAAHLAEALRTTMLGIVARKEISHCSVNAGPYDFTDSTTKAYRYQTVYTLYYV